jgi:hypothetical protein
MPQECIAMCRGVEQQPNWLLAMIHHDMYTNALQVQEWLHNYEHTAPLSKLWECLFPCIAVISNRKTANHRDSHGIVDCYDLLLSIGTADDLILSLPEVKVTLPYGPGTVVFINGRGLTHGVPEWEQGSDCCWAHFIREAHFEAAGLSRNAKWSCQADFGL